MGKYLFGLPEDLLRIIFRFVGFGDRPGRNAAAYRRINKQCHALLTDAVRVELDRGRTTDIIDFLRHFPQYKTELEQKRNGAMQWDDYRGFFIITQIDRDTWLYYDSLLETYFLNPRGGSFPHYCGKVYFYEFAI